MKDLTQGSVARHLPGLSAFMAVSARRGRSTLTLPDLLCAAGAVVAVIMGAIAGDAPEPAASPAPPAVVGLDHIPLAVNDLDGAAERYRRLGFTIKPGQPHPNGLRNQHVKFQDGTEIELITASEARDPRTAEYRRHLEAGDGPAFVALYAPDTNDLARRLDAVPKDYRRSGPLVVFLENDSLRYLFFGGRNASPTDRPEHFKHANGAEALIGVWLAGNDLMPERRLMATLGVPVNAEEVHAPERLTATVAHLQEGEIVFLPASHQLVKGRRIVGATLRVRDLKAVRDRLAVGGKAPATVVTRNGPSIFVPPSETLGLWLEFRGKS